MTATFAVSILSIMAIVWKPYYTLFDAVLGLDVQSGVRMNLYSYGSFYYLSLLDMPFHNLHFKSQPTYTYVSVAKEASKILLPS